MKKLLFWSLLATFLVGLFSCIQEEDFEDAFTFIVAADMRFYATEQYHTSQYFLGALDAIEKVGKGALMVTPGDMDPPGATRELISQVLGGNYPWYPVVGNHELDSPEYMQWLREYNSQGTSLLNIVNQGPPGCEETTYSFDWANCHFVVLNQYYNGTSDAVPGGDIAPELLAWLEQDLTTNRKTHVFVFGHEPIVSIPDMDNGRIRHQGNSLDMYPKRAFDFHQLLLQYDVTAYICGHTHNASFAMINGVWQIDAGHSRGIEIDGPDQLFVILSEGVDGGAMSGLDREKSIAEAYVANRRKIDKSLSQMGLDEQPALPALLQFYSDYQKGTDARNEYIRAFWENSTFAKSTFLKVYAGKRDVKVEMYRHDWQGGAYSLRHTIILDR